MLIHRRLVLAAAASMAATPALLACTSKTGHEEAVRNLRQPVAIAPGEHAALLRELVRLATLAPSSHNTQCWKFVIKDSSVTIAPDFARRTPAVDPDDHHLFVSLGCATENLAQAALAHGLQANAAYDAGADAIAVSLDATKAQASPLAQAIPLRQCSRGDYDGTALTPEELRLLVLAGSGQGVRMLLLTQRPAIEQVLEFVVAANSAQMNDPAFVEELKSWIRFSHDEALQTGDGLFSGATGNPALPRWLGLKAMGMFYTAKSENERYAKQIRSSAGIAVFVADKADKAHWIEAGRCYERFALQATLLGIRNAFLNQPVEVSAMRPQFATALGLGASRPDLVVRFGRGPTMPWSMRRPVQAVLSAVTAVPILTTAT